MYTIKIASLPAGTYARLQPETSDFQRNAADATEDILVMALSKRSALSEGDHVSVEIGDTVYWLRVQQLKPKPHVSVIGRILPLLAMLVVEVNLELASKHGRCGAGSRKSIQERAVN